MARRYSQAEKGKALVPPADPPRSGRVKVPDFDNSDLVKKHALTVIGRITNPKIQRMWSLIPFFTEHWKTSSPAIGADLGHGKFQFQFASKEDMQLVLDNRPYHYAHWMVILQKWEPTVSSTFPSQIPFSIKVQEAHAKMKVHVNGLLPLLNVYTLDFANGDEVEASLVYEKLEKHCAKCGMLDHEEVECPKNQAIQAPIKEFLPPPPSRRETPSSRPSRDSSRTVSERQRAEIRNKENWRMSSKARLSSRYQAIYNEGPDKDIWSYDSRSRNTYRGKERNPSYRSGSRTNPPPYEPYGDNAPRWVETGCRVANSVLADSTSRNRVKEGRNQSATHSERLIPTISDLPVEALTEAREEVREVMAQYTICADPTESAARKERMRLAEENGEFEQTAIQMVIHSIRNHQQRTAEREEEKNLEPLMHERVPATLWLGPVLTDIPIEEEPSRVPAKKRLGRPPNKKKVIANSPPLTKKRRMTQVASSPKRRLLLGSTSKKSNAKAPTKAKGQPSCSIIPAISKQRMGFQNPSSHLP
ncbi:unnamed protein product [Microthlaspi erraticum]|uniref:DUF4283 domain-containing protein n=1 Tax=Microthlaspi erraticum TaxID=1685480 RepID=A0A6D2LJR7_9BRAS|nr:unnamed protein product [Microthlaspi erraticum]